MEQFLRFGREETFKLGGFGVPGGRLRLRAKPQVSLRVSSACGYRRAGERQQGGAHVERPTLSLGPARAVYGQRAESQESMLVPSNCQGATGRCTCEGISSICDYRQGTFGKGRR